MSTPTVNPISVRYPFELRDQPHEVVQAHRFAFQGLVDLNQAIASLKGQIDKIKTGTTTTVTAAGSTSIVVNGSNFPGLGAVRDETGSTSYTIIGADNGILLILNDASPVSVALDSAMITPYFIFLTNFGAGTATLTPTSGTINGSASFSLPQYQSIMAVFDGTNWDTTALGPSGTEAYRAISSATTIISADFQIEVTAGTFTQPLPTAIGAQGKIYSIKNSGTGIVTMSTTGGQTIDGAATVALLQYDNMEVMSTGSGWIVI